MAETTGKFGKQKSYQKGGKQKSRQHRPLTDEEKAERTARLPKQGPDPAILATNCEALAGIAERMGIVKPGGDTLDIDIRNIARWLRSWPTDEPQHEAGPDEQETFDAERLVLDKALATVFLAGPQPTTQVVRLVADRHEYRIAVKRQMGQHWHEVRWGMNPMFNLDHATTLVKPSGALVDVKELPDGRWRCHFLPRVSAQNDLANLHHTRYADHWTAALACCTVILPR